MTVETKKSPRYNIPILLVVFTRLDTTRLVFECVREARPMRLYIAADGPRPGHPDDSYKIEQVRDYLLEQVDWDCEVKTLFREENIGCKRGPSEGITWFFEHEEKGIILEDDCVPTPEFFRFCAWALEKYRNNPKIGLVSGSNLIDYRFSSPYRNGFSKYINIWGWATWKDRWALFDPHIAIPDLKKLDTKLKNDPDLRLFERVFWKNIFKHMFTVDSIWDFFFQFAFFRHGIMSVYPTKNLVRNVGFGSDATHTHSLPDYVEKSMPVEGVDLLSLPVQEIIVINLDRDRMMTSTIWNCTPAHTARLMLMNLIRYINI